ncbi:MAG: DUF4367 domain-containing protein [Anaerolineales bacterium]
MEQNDSHIETLLETLPPDITPHLEKRLASAPWTPRIVRRNRVLTVVVTAIVLFATIMGVTPQGRAFAQTIFQFFTITNQSSIPISEDEIATFYAPQPPHPLALVDVTPSLDPCSNVEPTALYECKIQNLETQLNFDLKEFSDMPSGWIFESAKFYSPVSRFTNDSILAISYRNASGEIYFTQGIGEFPPDSDWESVPASALEAVKIGSYSGEYVSGYWGLQNGDNKLTWDEFGIQRIRWMEGDRRFEIQEMAGPGTTGYLDKEALIALASEIVYQPNPSEQTHSVDTNYIPNVAVAEKICQCSILEPTKLPQYMRLENAEYDAQRKSITLNYGYRALRIVQAPKETALFTNLDSYKDVETVQVGDVTGQYGISPLQKTIWDSSTPPAYPVSNTYSVLLWEKDGMIYQIYFDQSYSSGGQLTKEQIIEIAESLR